MSFINYQTPLNYKSHFNPVVGFSDEVREKINDFIGHRIKSFFSAIDENYELADFIELSDSITDKEFQNTSTELANSYFYEFLFTQIKKEPENKITDSLKFCITFDRDLTPLAIDGISYGIVKIASRPILYYVYIDLQELIRLSKSL